MQEYPYYRFPEDTISDGYGEYIVFRDSEEDSQIDKQLFRKLFPILKDSSLGGADGRSSLIEKQIQSIDPSLKIAFVPRVLFELLFTKTMIEHEMQKISFCDGMQIYKANAQRGFVPTFEPALIEEYWSGHVPDRFDSCWHIGGVIDDDWILNASEERKGMRAEVLAILAYRMNQLCVDKLHPKSHFTLGQIRGHLDETLKYFHAHAGIGRNGRIFDLIENRAFFRPNGPALSFGALASAYSRVQVEPTALTTSNRWIVDRALDIECSKAAEDAVVLYRAGSFEADKQIPDSAFTDRSLSFGTSLFAGSFEDGSACVFHYGAFKRRTIYALIIPKSELATSPFYYQSIDPIDQLTSKGELFHARSKLGMDRESEIEVGFCPSKAVRFVPSLLNSEGPAVELGISFRSYLAKGVSLTY